MSGKGQKFENLSGNKILFYEAVKGEVNVSLRKGSMKFDEKIKCSCCLKKFKKARFTIQTVQRVQSFLFARNNRNQT